MDERNGDETTLRPGKNRIARPHLIAHLGPKNGQRDGRKQGREHPLTIPGISAEIAGEQAEHSGIQAGQPPIIKDRGSKQQHCT